jgi:hypothetical protein
MPSLMDARATALWQYSEAVACAFAISARNSARMAQRQNTLGFAHDVSQAKVLLEEAAVVVAQPLHPTVTVQHVERAMETPAALPPSLALTDRQRETLAGSDPLCCSYARTVLAGSAARLAEEQRLALALADAYAEYREDELEQQEAVGVQLLADAQVELARALDTSVKAEVIDIQSRFGTQQAQQGLLRLVA